VLCVRIPNDWVSEEHEVPLGLNQLVPADANHSPPPTQTAICIHTICPSFAIALQPILPNNDPTAFINRLDITGEANGSILRITAHDPTDQAILLALGDISHGLYGTPTTFPWVIHTQQLNRLCEYCRRDRTPELTRAQTTLHHLLGETPLSVIPPSFDRNTAPLLDHVRLDVSGCLESDRPYISAWLATLTTPPLSCQLEHATISATQLQSILPITDLWMGIKNTLLSTYSLHEDATLATIWQAIHPHTPLPIDAPATVIPILMGTLSGTVAPSLSATAILAHCLTTAGSTHTIPDHGPMTGHPNPAYLTAAFTMLHTLGQQLRQRVTPRPSCIPIYRQIPPIPSTAQETIETLINTITVQLESERNVPKAHRINHAIQLMRYVNHALAIQQYSSTHPTHPAFTPSLRSIWETTCAIIEHMTQNPDITSTLYRLRSDLSHAILPTALSNRARTIHTWVLQDWQKIQHTLPPQTILDPTSQPSKTVTTHRWGREFSTFQQAITPPPDHPSYQKILQGIAAINTEFLRHVGNPLGQLVFDMMRKIVADLTTLQRTSQQYERVLSHLHNELLEWDTDPHCASGLKGRVQSLLMCVTANTQCHETVTQALVAWFQPHVGGAENSMQVEVIRDVLHEQGFAPPEPNHPIEYPEFYTCFQKKVIQIWQHQGHQEAIQSTLLNAVKQFYMQEIDDILSQNPSGITQVTGFFQQLAHSGLIDRIPDHVMTQYVHQTGDYHFNRTALEVLMTQLTPTIATRLGLLHPGP